MDEEKKKALEEAIGVEKAAHIIALADESTKQLEEQGVEFKEAEVAEEKAKGSFAERIRKGAEGIEDEALKKQVLAIADELGDYGYPEPEKQKEGEGEKAKPDLKKLGGLLRMLAGKAKSDALAKIAEEMLAVVEGKGKDESCDYGYPEPKKKKEAEVDMAGAVRSAVKEGLTEVARATAEAMGEMAAQVRSLQAEVAAMKEKASAVETEAEKARAEEEELAPAASLSELIARSVIGKAEVRLDRRKKEDRALAAGPTEEPDERPKTIIEALAKGEDWRKAAGVGEVRQQ